MFKIVLMIYSFVHVPPTLNNNNVVVVRTLNFTEMLFDLAKHIIKNAKHCPTHNNAVRHDIIDRYVGLPVPNKNIDRSYRTTTPPEHLY